MITMTHLKALLSAADAAGNALPPVGITTKDGFRIDRGSREELRSAIRDMTDADLTGADAQADVKESVEAWRTHARVWKIANVVAACDAILGE